MRRSARKVLWLLAVLAAGTAIGRAQPNTAAPEAPATFSLVDGREPMTLLVGSWRFQPGDDPRYSDPGFDDSHWPLLRSDRPWSDQGYKELSGFAWYRFKIVLPPGPGSSGDDKYSLLLPSIHTMYQCFVDGKLLRTTGVFPPKHDIVYRSAPVIVPLPDGARATPRTLQVAIRVWQSPTVVKFQGGGVVPNNSPLGRVGQTRMIEEYYRLREIAQQHNNLANLLIGIVDMLAGLAGLTFFLFRRTAREYLWFSLGSFVGGVFPIMLYVRIDRLWSVPAMDTIAVSASLVSELSSIALLKRLLNAPTGWLLRAAVGGMLLDFVVFFPAEYGNAISFGTSNALHSVLQVPAVVWFIVLLTRRVREGVTDARLLLVPIGFILSVTMLNLVVATSATLGHPLGIDSDPVLFEYPFPVSLDGLQDVFFLLAMVAILVNRFLRTSREQERVSGEMQAARSLQKVLIPEALPEIPGLKIAAAYHPANEVGGDFFQIVPLKSGETLVVLGDVSGKGLAAAMTVSLAVGTIRTLAEITDSPAEILAGLNRRLCGRDGFTTCLALRLSPAGEMTIANAGHLAPYLNGREMETEPALPLGLDFDARFAEKTMQLGSNDQLTILTDGVPEAENHKELFGFARTENLSTQGASYIADAAREFGQNDDITVLTLTMLRAGTADA